MSKHTLGHIILIIIVIFGTFIYYFFNKNKFDYRVVDRGATATSSELGLEPKETKLQENMKRVMAIYNQVLPTLPEHNLYCIPSTKSYCTKEGCEDVKADVFNLVGNSPDLGLFIARCDTKPCDIYPVNLIPKENFMEFTIKDPRGMLFKVSQIDQSFLEVVTLGTDSFVSQGKCYLKADR